MKQRLAKEKAAVNKELQSIVGGMSKHSSTMTVSASDFEIQFDEKANVDHIPILHDVKNQY